MIEAQNLSDFQWKNRIILVMADNPNNQDVKSQAALFADEVESMNERKIIFIQAFPEFNLMGTNNLVRRNSGGIYFNNKDSKMVFELRLIGLDGDTKLKSKDLVSPQRIYDLIDSMPMRRSGMN